jgi:inorganic pyrophosphatase/K(+)-stimulated pyrophosphate-energized sodium pump
MGLGVVSLGFAFYLYAWVSRQDAGGAREQQIAGYIQEGARAYLSKLYGALAKLVAVLAVVIALVFSLDMLESVKAGQLVGSTNPLEGVLTAIAFVVGAGCSGLAGFLGMSIAVRANLRSAVAAKAGLNPAFKVAFYAGAVLGMAMVGSAVIGISTIYLLTSDPEIVLGFSLGASAMALLAKAGGGIYTKSADIAADLVGKVEAGIPEDDPRNPAVIADNVGDNVGDVAGMGADLYESYCGSILATSALGVAAFIGDYRMQMAALFLPITIAAVGTLLSIWGIWQVKTKEDSSQKALLAALAQGINISTIAIVAASFVLTFLLVGWSHLGIALSVIVGLVAGWLIGKWTEYSTSNEYAPTKELADQALTGPATIIIGGIAEGMLSTWAPVLITSVATLLSFGFANGFDFSNPNSFALGLYGVGIAAVGMLSTLGITLATDAYGPIADNAGGNAQMAGLPEFVRERTDALDALGNTTAATGKGFAIGSAALTALALLAAYIEEVRIGFDRWGHSVVEHVTGEPGNMQHITVGGKARPLNEGEWVKLAGGLAVRVGATPEANSTWMLLDKKALPGFGDVRSGTVVDKMPTAAQIDSLESEGRIVAVKNARMADYMRFYDATLMNPKVLVGLFIGAMSTFVFCALTMKAVGRAAKGMVEEVRRQFREKPGIMQGTDTPDYAAPVAISTKAAQKEMILPSMLALLVPIVTGLLLGVGGVMGLLVGGLTTGFCVAVFMANAGGAWDNAKKHIESGVHGGKGTDAHKAAVVGDTVGDPFKDTSGPSLNILVKLMSMVSVVVAGLVVRYSLEALGIF